MGGLIPKQIYHYHGTDEAYCAKHTDGWEMLYGIQPGFRKGGIGYGIGEGQRGHIECYAQGVEREQIGHRHLTALT